jgi:uncharacterized membrane protein
MTLIPGWHPIVVHFPLALIVTATLLLVTARLLRHERYAATLATVGTWNLCLGAIAALFALATGLAAVGLIVTGYRGGQNVYRYGVGVTLGSLSAATRGSPLS